MTDRTPTGDTPTHGVHVIPGEVPEGVVPPSTSMRAPAPTDDLRERLAHAMAHAPGTAYQACNDDMYLRLADAALPVVEAWAAGRAPSDLQGSPTAWSNDLRDRITAALRAQTSPTASHEVHGDVLDVADAVLPVVEAETAALRQRIEEVEDQRDQALAWQDTAERKLQQALDQIATERRGRLAAEAANRRVRALIDSYPPGSQFARSGAQDLFRVTLCTEGRPDETLAAVDAEQPKETR